MWCIKKRGTSDSEDGTRAQKYLEKALQTCADLDSNSRELESFIRNHENEYHLSSLRANLLRAFWFRPDATVLEIGCECGAVTRFLGEKCESVTAIESNPANVHLARLRTRDQDNVEVICASLEDIPFSDKFDIILALGLFENNSPSGTPDSGPEYIVRQLADHLHEEGTLLLAADNPFGLGWLSTEEKNKFQGVLKGSLDGTGPCCQNELIRILKPCFGKLDLYFPYPEYRLAECILSDKMVRRVSVGELLGNFRTCDEGAGSNTSFNEKLTLLELDKENRLQSFANSFLVVAGREHHSAVRMNGLGMIFSKGRRRELQATTKFVDSDGTGIKAIKRAVHPSPMVASGQLRLLESECDWVGGYSLQLELLFRTIRPDLNIENIFEPAKEWLKYLRSHAVHKERRLLLDGSFIDHIWKNCFLSNQQCRFIDKEWKWGRDITVNTLLIRSIFLFLKDVIDMPGVPHFLAGNSVRSTIREIARALDTELTRKDFNDYLRLEAEFQSMVYGRSKILNLLEHRLILWNRSAYNRLGKLISTLGKPQDNE